MKIKKIQVLRPDFEVEYEGNSILARILLLWTWLKLPKLVKANIGMNFKKIKWSGYTFWFVVLPKIKLKRGISIEKLQSK